MGKRTFKPTFCGLSPDIRRLFLDMSELPFRANISLGSGARSFDNRPALQINDPLAVRMSKDRLHVRDLWESTGLPVPGNHTPLSNFIQGNKIMLDKYMQHFAPNCAVSVRKQSAATTQEDINCMNMDDFLQVVTELQRKGNWNSFFVEKAFMTTDEFFIVASPWLRGVEVKYCNLYEKKGGKYKTPTVYRDNGDIYSASIQFTEEGEFDYVEKFILPTEWNSVMDLLLQCLMELDIDLGTIFVGYNEYKKEFSFLDCIPGCDISLDNPHTIDAAANIKRALPVIIKRKAMLSNQAHFLKNHA